MGELIISYDSIIEDFENIISDYTVINIEWYEDFFIVHFIY